MSDLEAAARQRTFLSRIRQDPLLGAGIAGFLGVVGYSIFNYRKKSAGLKTSVYVIQTRVVAQSLVVGILLIGLGRHMYEEIQHPHPPHHSPALLHPELKK